eukprot:CAMPEP_0172441268 /NCGR_PEP_ID=MMETSP1065-20121228/1822_1 /TAXON_ID=265537 /ORGANISM="Amphiprora paludosa, Strain CCMP125" /LENGTH=333 /DNA_ID=CAMNT_0013190531 /DNA_START=86 /DNA_END=1087 /DNA_ORIENTATION=+
MLRYVLCAIALACRSTYAFSPISTANTRWSPSVPATELSRIAQESSALWSVKNDGESKAKKGYSFASFRKRFDTLDSIGLKDEALTAGLGQKIKSLHNPITYLGLSAMALIRWNSLGRNPVYWFATAFCVKWYRARYVFKIPVWDRQPNWNNIITSKEQEKDLKAFTCKKCGSTIFIAKTREFFFEGSTGIGGLGCFTCGAKGAENFEMDRDRIVEDVGDLDDYFEYERPLDFVSRAERRKLMQETQGDEEKANQILLERAETSEESSPEVASSTVDEGTEAVEEPSVVEEPKEPTKPTNPELKVEPSSEPKADDSPSADSSEDELDALDMDL